MASNLPAFDCPNPGGQEPILQLGELEVAFVSVRSNPTIVRKVGKHLHHSATTPLCRGGLQMLYYSGVPGLV